MVKKTTILLSDDNYKWIKDNCMKLSAIVNKALKEYRERDD